MELIVRPRGHGSTTELLHLAERDYSYIVCPTRQDVDRLWRIAREQNLKIPQPITWDEFMRRRYSGRGIAGFVIDDLDRCIQSMTHVEIKAISMKGSLPRNEMQHLTFREWGAWRVGWPDRIDPPVKRGRWWLRIGPWLVGKPDETW